MIVITLYRILFLCVGFYISSLLLDFSVLGTAWADTPHDSIEEVVRLDENDNDTTQPVLSKGIPIYTSLKRIFYWRFIEKGKGNYGSYKEFKQCWDPKTKIWKDVKHVVKSYFSPTEKQMYDDYVTSRERDNEFTRIRQERERKSYLYEAAKQKELDRCEKERMVRYYARFGKRK
jgi:hypothetical protein